MDEKRFYEPVVEELGAGQWGVWIDDGDEICVCDSSGPLLGQAGIRPEHAAGIYESSGNNGES